MFQLFLHRPVQLPAVLWGLAPLWSDTGGRGGIVSVGRILTLRPPSDGEGGGGGGAGGEDRVGGKVRKNKAFLWNEVFFDILKCLTLYRTLYTVVKVLNLCTVLTTWFFNKKYIYICLSGANSWQPRLLRLSSSSSYSPAACAQSCAKYLFLKRNVFSVK